MPLEPILVADVGGGGRGVLTLTQTHTCTGLQYAEAQRRLVLLGGTTATGAAALRRGLLLRAAALLTSRSQTIQKYTSRIKTAPL